MNKIETQNNANEKNKRCGFCNISINKHSFSNYLKSLNQFRNMSALGQEAEPDTRQKAMLDQPKLLFQLAKEHLGLPEEN